MNVHIFFKMFQLYDKKGTTIFPLTWPNSNTPYQVIQSVTFWFPRRDTNHRPKKATKQNCHHYLLVESTHLKTMVTVKLDHLTQIFGGEHDRNSKARRCRWLHWVAPGGFTPWKLPESRCTKKSLRNLRNIHKHRQQHQHPMGKKKLI